MFADPIKLTTVSLGLMFDFEHDPGHRHCDVTAFRHDDSGPLRPLGKCRVIDASLCFSCHCFILSQVPVSVLVPSVKSQILHGSLP
jgi:hypothetical protein